MGRCNLCPPQHLTVSGHPAKPACRGFPAWLHYVAQSVLFSVCLPLYVWLYLWQTRLMSCMCRLQLRWILNTIGCWRPNCRSMPITTSSQMSVSGEQTASNYLFRLYCYCTSTCLLLIISQYGPERLPTRGQSHYCFCTEPFVSDKPFGGATCWEMLQAGQ